MTVYVQAMATSLKVATCVLFISFLAYLFLQVCERNRIAPLRKPDLKQLHAEYDYIVVGAGTAGSVLANRLSEDGKHTVLVLEAGKDDSLFKDVHVPGATFALHGNPDTDWMFQTIPQKHACKSMHDHKCSIPRGKVLGGSSSINCMIYGRGSPADYDLWAEEYGSRGWSYKEVLPHFVRSENNQNPRMDSRYHGKDGPVVVSDANVTSLAEDFLHAAREAGYDTGDLSEAEDPRGMVMQVQATVNKGSRWSTADAYLRPAMDRPNLHVVTEAMADKIVFQGDTAKGIQYSIKGDSQLVNARKEVILSAGSIGSAQLLQLSGVGPRDLLETLHIPVVKDLPVGEHLQDHMMLFAPEFTLNQSRALTSSSMRSYASLAEYLLFGTGPLAGVCGVDAIGHFGSSSGDSVHSELPHFAVELLNYFLGNDASFIDGFAKSANIKADDTRHVYGGNEGKEGIILLPMIFQTYSSGNLRIRTRDPDAPPDINPNYLSDERDVKILIEGIRVAQELSETTPLRSLGTSMVKNVHPECRQHEFDSDVYWECFIRHMAVPLNHPAGTCRMGAVSDNRAVVGPDLAVRGLKKLRVVDASVMPRLVSAGPLATVIMIGEKASDMILGKV